MSGRPAGADALRISRFDLIGCIACYKDGHIHEPYDCHHLVEGYRLGHRYTIPLCPWHHRGVPGQGSALKGPSMATDKKAFVAKYGSERSLLTYTDQLLGYQEAA